MGPPRPPSPGELACCGAARRAPGGSRVTVTPGGASPGSSGRARYGACGPVPAGPCGEDRPSPAGRRESPGRVAGGRWSVGRAGMLRAGPAGQPRSAVGGGGRRARQPRLVLGAGHGPAGRWPRCGVVRGRAAVGAGLPRLVLGAGPAGWLGGCVPLGPGTGAGGHGVLPGAAGAGLGCRCCPRCPGGASQDHRAGLPDRLSRQAWREWARCRAPPGARRCVPLAAGRRAPGRCRPRARAGPWAAGVPRAAAGPRTACVPRAAGVPWTRLPLPGAAGRGPSCRCPATRPRPRRAMRPRAAPRHAASSAPRHAASSAPGTGGGRYPGACSPGISAGSGPSGSPAPARLRGGRPSCRSA